MFQDELCLAEPEIDRILIKRIGKIRSQPALTPIKKTVLLGEDLCHCLRGRFAETAKSISRSENVAMNPYNENYKHVESFASWFLGRNRSL